MKLQQIQILEESRTVLKFQNHHKQMCIPYIIYADFEVLNIPVEGAAMGEQHTD